MSAAAAAAPERLSRAAATAACDPSEVTDDVLVAVEVHELDEAIVMVGSLHPSLSNLMAPPATGLLLVLVGAAPAAAAAAAAAAAWASAAASPPPCPYWA